MVNDVMAEAQASLDEINTEVDKKAETPEALVEQSVPPPAAPTEPAAAGSTFEFSEQLKLLGDVDLHVMIELGRTDMLVEDVLKLGEGSVVELDKLAGDPVDVFVNQRLVARGEVLVLNDKFCIRISEIVEDLETQAEAALEQQQAREAV